MACISSYQVTMKTLLKIQAVNISKYYTNSHSQRIKGSYYRICCRFPENNCIVLYITM